MEALIVTKLGLSVIVSAITVVVYLLYLFWYLYLRVPPQCVIEEKTEPLK